MISSIHAAFLYCFFVGIKGRGVSYKLRLCLENLLVTKTVMHVWCLPMHTQVRIPLKSRELNYATRNRVCCAYIAFTELCTCVALLATLVA